MSSEATPGRPRPAPRSAAELFPYIESFTNVERGDYSPRAYRLERMQTMLEALGNPHRAVPAIHVAGSKGKGSVCAYIEHALHRAGYRVGRYASPHAVSYNERFSLGGREATLEELFAAAPPVIEYAESAIAKLPQHEWPTTFELLTTLAFLLYRAQRLEYAVLEVGLGGRLDATNVVDPVASLISVIELEHTEYLGSTVAEIAREKGGIIKPGRPVYLQRQTPEAMEVLLEIATERDAPCLRVDETFEARAEPGREGNRIELRPVSSGPSAEETQQRISFVGSMLGHAQAANASLAALFLRNQFPQISIDQIGKAFAAAALPGRGELVAGSPSFLLDGAHTPSSVAEVARIAAVIEPEKARRTLIFGCARDKRVAEMAQILCPLFARIVVTRPGTFKQSDLGAIRRAFEQAETPPAEIESIDSAAEALDLVRQRASGLVVITGSFYLMGEVRPKLRA